MSKPGFKSTVSIEWWTEGPQQDVNESDKDILQDHAFEHASRMITDGFREGELSTSISSNEGPIPYRGWWTFRDVPTNQKREFSLPFDIEITAHNDSAELSSCLDEAFLEEKEILDDEDTARVEFIETFLMMLAKEGVDLSDPKIGEALEATVDFYCADNGDKSSQPAEEPGTKHHQRFDIEDAGGEWAEARCMFRCFRGENFMDVERLVTIPKDCTQWTTAFEEESRRLEADPYNYSRVQFLSICKA